MAAKSSDRNARIVEVCYCPKFLSDRKSTGHGRDDERINEFKAKRPLS